MIFFTGFAIGTAVGALVYRYFYSLECNRNEVLCNDREKDKELQKQLERLIAYGNDI